MKLSIDIPTIYLIENFCPSYTIDNVFTAIGNFKHRLILKDNRVGNRNFKENEVLDHYLKLSVDKRPTYPLAVRQPRDVGRLRKNRSLWYSKCENIHKVICEYE